MIGLEVLTGPVQTFFVPKSISGLRLSKLPASAALSAALKKLRVGSFGDLNELSFKDFQSVSDRSPAIVTELGELIQRARNGEFRQATLHRSGVGQRSINTPTSPNGTIPQPPADELIFIPQEARGQAFSNFSLSVRAQHVLEDKGFLLLGDLHGRSYSDFGKYRNCGKKTVAEVRELVRIVQRTQTDVHPTAIEQTADSFSARVGDNLSVPVEIRGWNLCDLPVSVRLEKLLKRKKLHRLGDLHGMSIESLLAVGNCGKKTIAEIVRLIEKTAGGEFNSVAEVAVAWAPAELLRFLDGLIADLSARDMEILVMRLGGDQTQPSTLEDVGTKFKLTRERIRQIVKKTAATLRKAGSRKLNAYLSHIEHACHELVCPFAPALLEQWLAGETRVFRFSISFYVRLLSELHPSIPAWAKGQESSFRRGIPKRPAARSAGRCRRWKTISAIPTGIAVWASASCRLPCSRFGRVWTSA